MSYTINLLLEAGAAAASWFIIGIWHHLGHPGMWCAAAWLWYQNESSTECLSPMAHYAKQLQ
jgi:hypothetical protein